MTANVYCLCFQQQMVEYVTVSYRDDRMTRKYVDYSPGHT